MNYTTAQVAELLSLDVSRIRRLAISRNVGKRHGHAWVFTDADIEAMRVRIPGNPAWRSRGA